MTSSKVSQKEQDLRSAEKAAVAKARAECRTALENACVIELDACRKALENVEQLKLKLKQATSEKEKQALKKEIKQVQSSTREIITHAKKCRADQEKKILASEADTVSRIKQETRKALAALKVETGAEQTSRVAAPGLPVTPDFDTASETVELKKKKSTEEDAPRQDLDKGAAKDKKALAGDEVDPNLNLDEILHPDFEEPLPPAVPEVGPEQVISDTTFEEIRRELEETIKRLEQSRKEKSKIKPEREVSEPGSSMQAIATDEDTREDFENGLHETAAISPVEDDLVTPVLPLDETNKETTPPEPELPVEEVPVLEGRIKLIVEGLPSANSIKKIGEKLKQVEGLKVLLMGGSIEEGVLIILLAQKPLALTSFLGQIPGVVISSVYGNEIRLRIA